MTVTDALWKRYRDEGDPDARAELLNCYLGLVHHSAREIAGRIGNTVELDDLVSAGTLGLVKALESFELERGLAFSTYAVRRIKGSILDELRSLDWLPRSARARGRQIAAAVAELESKLERPAEPREVAGALGIDLSTFWKWREDMTGGLTVPLDGSAGDDHGSATLEETLADPEAPRPDEMVTREEGMAAVRDAIGKLPPRERTVLALYYYEEMNLKQIAEVLHVTESRVSQIRTQALKRLKGQFTLMEQVRP